MAEITVKEHTADNIAEFVVTGPVSADEIIAIAEKHSAFKLRRHLVDMTGTNFYLLDSAALARIAESFKLAEQNRPSGRTAIVVPPDFRKVIPQLFSFISNEAGREEVFKITMSRDEAWSWLSANEDLDRESI